MSKAMMMTPISPLSRAISEVRGSGGGAKQPKQRTPVDSPDSVKSKALLSLLDLLCEGQIKGLVAGEQSIFLDGTSLANPDGSKNFSGYNWQFRDGRQDQTVIEGFPDISTPYNVGTQLKFLTPYTFTVSNNDADQVRVIITLPALSIQSASTGDSVGTSVTYKFAVSNNGGPFMPVNVLGTSSDTVTINDKSHSKYQREHLLTLPKPGSNYKVRVTRVTADSTGNNLLQNDTYVDSYYEIINSKLFYPNSALFGITIDSEQFSSLPARSYLIDGLFVRVPSNYDVETRSYTGIWDGSFKIGFTSNPAWILYDLLLDKRYGLGGFIKESQVNKAKLYQIGRYCDGMVSNGFGGMEPRFTLNTCIQAQADAYKVIADICSVFRGMSYWSGGMVQVTQDSPTDPVYLFNNSNVIDGMFHRVGSARKDRHSVVHVQWNDPEDNYKQKIEYVEDPDLVRSMGYRRLDTLGFGCTSRAQAHRIGLWILYTEKVETNIINFSVGLEGVQCMPGDIIQFQDQYKAGKRNSGRLKAVSRMGCTLDKPTQISAGSMIAIRMPNGKFEEVQVNQVGLTDTLTFGVQLSEVPKANTVWILIELNLVPELGRCVGVSQGEKPHEFVISVVEHNPSKFASIEQGLRLETLPTTIIDPTFSTPEAMLIKEFTYLAAPGQIASRIDVSWEGKSPLYYISWRGTLGAETSGWTTETVNKAQFSLFNVVGGTIYDFKVVSQSVTGKMSQELVGSYTALGNLNPPMPAFNLTAKGDFRQIILNWERPVSVDFDYIRIYENTVDDVETAYVLDRTAADSYTRTGIPGLMKYWYWIKVVNKRGMASDFNSTAGTSAVAGVIAETDLDRELAEAIHSAGDKVIEMEHKLDEAIAGTEQTLRESNARADAARALTSIEQLMRESDEVQIKRDIFDMGVTLGEDIAAQIKQVRETAVSELEAISRDFEEVNARFGVNEAYAISETMARTDRDNAIVTVLTQVYAQTENNHANIIQERDARTNADNAMASTFEAVLATTKDELLGIVTAQITAEQSARVDGDTAIATNLQTVKTQLDNAETRFANEITALSNADQAIVGQLTAMNATMNNNTALISAEATARATADDAIATELVGIKSRTDDIIAQFTSEITTLTNKDQALTARIDTVEATSASFDAAAAWEFDEGVEGWAANQATLTAVGGVLRYVPTGAGPYLGVQQISGTVGINGRLNKIVRVRLIRKAGTGWNGAVYYSTASHGITAGYVKQIPNPALGIGNVTTIDVDMSTLTAGGDDWVTNNILSLRLDLGAAADQFDIEYVSIGRIGVAGYAAAQQTTKALAETNGKLSTNWNIKLNVTSDGKFYAAGMGIGIETNGQGVAQSQVVFQANRFVIFDPDLGEGSAAQPFYVVSGQVFINTALIGNATIQNAQIGDVLYSTTLGANGRPVWLLSKDGTFELNGQSTSTSRIMRSTYDRYYDANSVPRIEIGELM